MRARADGCAQLKCRGLGDASDSKRFVDDLSRFACPVARVRLGYGVWSASPAGAFGASGKGSFSIFAGRRRGSVAPSPAAPASFVATSRSLSMRGRNRMLSRPVGDAFQPPCSVGGLFICHFVDLVYASVGDVLRCGRDFKNKKERKCALNDVFGDCPRQMYSQFSRVVRSTLEVYELADFVGNWLLGCQELVLLSQYGKMVVASALSTS